MEFIKNAHIDFIKMRKAAYLFSSILILTSLILYAMHWTKNASPFNLGIQFTGGTAIQIKFRQPVKIDKVRKTLASIGYGHATIQHFGSSKDEILIRLKSYEGKTNEIRDKILGVLETSFSANKQNAGKSDLNQIDSDKAFYDELKKLPEFADISKDYTSQVNLQQEAISIMDYKTSNSGIISDFSDLRKVPALRASTLDIIKKHFYLGDIVLRNSSMIGPSVGKTLRDKAMQAVIFAILAVLIYIWWRFDFKFGVAAIVALIHDVLITSGVFVLTQREMTLAIIAALLTIFGYSLNDTIVVSDRIRENYRKLPKTNFKDVVNLSINETLSRTIITSLTTLFTVLALFLFGGEVIHDFSLAMLVGIGIGTYSSIFVVSPIVYEWHMRTLPGKKK